MDRRLLATRLQHFLQRLRHPTLPLSEQIARLRWQVPLLALFLVLAHQSLEHFWFAASARFTFISEMLIYGVSGPLVVWLALGWIKHKVALKEAAEAELVQAHAELTRLNRRISFLFEINRRLSEVTDEESLAVLALRLPSEIVPRITGCALVRFDDQHQPMPIEYAGTLDEEMLSVWHRHLSTQSVRHRCKMCHVRSAQIGQPCPLLERLPLLDVGGIVCQALDRNGREFAILGMFLPMGYQLTDEERNLIESVASELAIAFENTRLRTRELIALYEINETLQQRLGFDKIVNRILTQTMEASNADAGMVLLLDSDGSLLPRAAAGEWREANRLPLIEGLAEGSLQATSGEPVVAELQSSDPCAASILCVPMIAEQHALGVIVLGSQRRESFLRPQIRLVSAIAGQAALLAENARLYAQREHQVIVAERGRLAREMHDGLAQTLGYLKMRVGQIARWIESYQSERASSALHELAQTINDAYLELRTALDGLRAQPNAPFAAELRRLADTFASQSGLEIEMIVEAEPQLSASAQAHLLRIVQESLANARKHAQANYVRLTLSAQDNHLQMLVEDDGQGFDAGQDLPQTRHGLRVMRERADLLGADLQVTSAPGLGTRVYLELPT
jgi:two-component system nitrate/nitrite sensor histidine kinase NarX